MDNSEEALALHEKLQGKISVQTKMDINTDEELALVYTPGVAAPCLKIAANPEDVWKYTIKRNTVAIISDGTAVLGLGDIGPEAALPVMEGKAMLFKKFAGIDAFPICLNTKDQDEIVKTIRHIAPVFGGINLEDISAPRSFFIEQNLQDLGIPVFHDDQHGTAIVVLAALMNTARVVGKSLFHMNVVINGAGAAGIAIAKFIRCVGHENSSCISVNDVILCDSKGIIHKGRENLNDAKKEMLKYSNKNNRIGSLKDALVGADLFIGVSKGDLIDRNDVRTMNEHAAVFALANPTPEIMPDEAKAGGALVVATGRSDFPNQVNNVLGFPGIFRGALDARAKQITSAMKLAAAEAIADCIENPRPDYIIPTALDETVAKKVAEAVTKTAMQNV